MSKDAFWDQGVDVVIHRGVLTEEAYTWSAATFGYYPELDHQLLALAGCSQEEFLFLVSLLYCAHSASLVDPQLRHLGDLQAACIVDERVFYVNKQTDLIREQFKIKANRCDTVCFVREVERKIIFINPTTNM